MPKLKKGNILDLEVIDNAYGGKGIAKIPVDGSEFVLFVPNTIKGQKVKARIVKKKNSFAECKLIDIIEHAPSELATPYQRISGAPFAQLPIEQQEDIKKKQTVDLYQRIGKVANINELLDGYISSPSTWHYRNKMEYSFSAIGFDVEKQEEFDGFALGFKKRGTWWIVENLEKDSGLFDERFENNLWKIRSFCKNSGLPAWHPPQKKGFFRYLVVRKSFSTNQFLIKLVTTSDNVKEFDFSGFTRLILDTFGERIAGILHTTNDDIGDNAQSRFGTETVLYGNKSIKEELLGLSFDISMESFFQTNPKCAELLYQRAIDYLLQNDEVGESTIIDLFCGTGTIGQLVANNTTTNVIGVDIVEEAIKDAKSNAKINNISNINFYHSDVGRFLMDHPQFRNKIKSIIVDPPRAGIAKKTLHRIIELQASKIVYISCNPSTQVRDIELLSHAGYQLKKLSLVDQFPHTAHIEAVALLIKADERGS